MRLIEEPDQSPRLDVTSLIDVTFSILAFFIISTLFLAQNLGVTVNLPRADTAKLQKSIRINLSITSTNEIFINREKIEPNTLEERVQKIQSQFKGQEVVVLIQADAQVTHGKVVRVMDRLRKIPNLKLAIATTRNKGND